MNLFILVLGILLLALISLWYFVRKRRVRYETPETQASEEHFEDSPKQIVIGESPNNPNVVIESFSPTAKFEKGTALDIHSGPVSRLAAMLGAAPSVLVDMQASGKNLMQVVINGGLVPAADGNGLRAFAIGPRGIKEHARLFEAGNLQNIINAAAIWQVASVLVAQKHLADISSKLDKINDNIHAILQFLDSQRRSRIRSTYDYLLQAYHALRAGELSPGVRNELESCERDLLEIQHHIDMEYRHTVENRVKPREAVGTRELTDDIRSKIDCLERLAEEAELCLKTRIAAWQVLSLYPNEGKLSAVRRSKIEQSIESFESLQNDGELIRSEIERINSWLNRNSTLEQRRSMLLTKFDSSRTSLLRKSQQIREMVASSDQLVELNARPMRILLQFNDGALVEAREL